MFSDMFWALYWIDVLSDIPNFLTILVMGGLLSVFVVGMATEGRRMLLSLWGIIPSLVLGLLLLFAPSKQTMYMMLGVKTTEHVVESPLGKKLQQIIDLEVDNYFKKVTKSNGN
jgi:hypothetical protein